MRTRFAPSPTGYLHIGNARTALQAYLAIKKLGGEFWLRIDDTDQERSSKTYIEQIEKDLKWLGMSWDGYFCQSQRFARYEEIKNSLIASGRLYPCFETAEELELKRKVQLGRNLPPIYDRAALKLSTNQQQELIASGKNPHYRFRLKEGQIAWNDLIRGEIKFNAEHISDPIVIRGDGSFTYLLCSVIDDIDYHITHILRGEDHISNTAVQIQMIEALGGETPTFGHLCMFKSKEGKISKRIGGFEIKSLREEGYSPMAINSLLAKLGSSDPVKPYYQLSDLIQEFDFTKCGRAAVNYDVEDLDNLNHKYVTHASHNQVKNELQELGLSHIDAKFWEGVHANISKLDDLKLWWQICREPVEPVISPENKTFLSEAAGTLPKNINAENWAQWIAAVKQASGKQGKALFMPLRLAITGLEHGPEMPIIATLIGHEKLVRRLKGEKC